MKKYNFQKKYNFNIQYLRSVQPNEIHRLNQSYDYISIILFVIKLLGIFRERDIALNQIPFNQRSKERSSTFREKCPKNIRAQIIRHLSRRSSGIFSILRD